MSRSTSDAPISTPTARERLAPRGEPYYRAIHQGLALGYRRGRRGGSWLARIRLPDSASYLERKLGTADDGPALPDQAAILSYPQAVKKAEAAYIEAEAKRLSGTLPQAARSTLNDVFDIYRAAYVRGDTGRDNQPGRDLPNLDSVLKCHLRPKLGATRLDRLNAEMLKNFRNDLPLAPRLSRSGNPVVRDRDDDFDEKDALRARRNRANRILNVLRAALNYAKTQHWFATDAAWNTALAPYSGVDQARIRYLSVDESERLKGHVEEDFRRLVRGALLTGCRFGSLRHLTCGDVDLAARTALTRITKSGETQIIRLTREGCQFLGEIVKGKRPKEFVFVRADGEQWRPSDQQRRMEKGCSDAGIDPAITFHGMRDTFASHLVMAGVPLLTVSKLLGHKDTRTTEKYYAHLAPDHLQKAIDDHLPKF